MQAMPSSPPGCESAPPAGEDPAGAPSVTDPLSIDLRDGFVDGHRPGQRARPGPPTGVPSASGTTPARLLYVTARYLPFVGGTEIHTAELARRMVAAGHDVTVLTTDPHARRTTVEDDRGVRVVRVRAWPKGSDLYLAPGIHHWITEHHWDLVHVQGYHTFVAPIAMAAAARSGQPYVVTFHSGGHTSTARRLLRPAHRRALRPLFAKAERLIGVSRFETELFRASLGLPEDRFVTVPNGTTLPRPKAVGASDRRVICSVGRVEKYKGHHRLVSAMSTLRARIPDVELWIVGDGSFRPSIERLAARLGVADLVQFRPVPSADRREMASLLSQAELVVSLSAYESQGMAVLEALALGRPVLVADTSALADLAGSGRVRAVPPRCSDEELAATVRRCLEEPLVPGQVPLPRWDEMADALARIYADVVPSLSPAAESGAGS